ncbi:MAG TPA: AMP-binding protein, partial [Geobacteraceae bacterium]|nr:AMP-binding protein [Geobacteraceae bacterium]
MKTLIDLFESFRGQGDQVAFVHRTGVRRHLFTYGQLCDMSLKMNRLLAESGVERGDRVLIWGPNSPWWAISFWGIIA